MSKAQILVGTSGWSYKEWEGSFYQKSERRKLRAYASVFKTVEIDSTFYRNPTKGTVIGWERYSPPDFVFTAKLPKLITHTKRLGLNGNVREDLAEFLELMHPLQLSGKLACLLIQLPPKYGFNPKNLREFFEMLDPRFRYAIEFRNESWLQDETWQLLQDHSVAYTNVDEPLLPAEVHITSDFGYFRWHGRGERIWFDYEYAPDEIDRWVPKIEKAAAKARKILGYFNNHFHGYAPENALYLLSKLGLASEQQKRKKAAMGRQPQITDFFKT